MALGPIDAAGVCGCHLLADHRHQILDPFGTGDCQFVKSLSRPGMPFGSMSLLSCLNGFHGTSVARTVRWRTEAKRTYHHDSSTPRCLPSPTAFWVQGIVARCSSVHGCCPFGTFWMDVASPLSAHSPTPFRTLTNPSNLLFAGSISSAGLHC